MNRKASVLLGQTRWLSDESFIKTRPDPLDMPHAYAYTEFLVMAPKEIWVSTKRFERVPGTHLERQFVSNVQVK
jgi:hypothetical protein